MLEFFHIILTRPLLNALIWFYNIIPGQDMGLAILALTVLVRLLLFPSFQKSLRSQKELQALQPKLNELKQKYKDDKEAQTRATLELYKEHKINPLSSCLPLLLQLPILIALYQVFLVGLSGNVGHELYPFIHDPGAVNTGFFGLTDLLKPSYVFAVLAGLFQFVQSKMMVPKKSSLSGSDKTAAIMNAQMVYLMPLITVFIGIRLPAGLSLYWMATTLFAIGQQWYIMKQGAPSSK